jgi:hypothetical protein
MRAVGRLFDLSAGFAPVDTQTGANTGLRICMRNYDGVAFVLYKGAGTGTDAPVFTLQEHNASTAGTSQNLAVITEYLRKSATTLAGTETWTRTTQTAAATLTLTGEATKQGIYVIEVMTPQLSDGFSYLSLSVADTGSAGAQLAGLLAIPYDLKVMRKPANLAASLI